LPAFSRFWELQTKVSLGYSSKAAHFERSAFEGTEDKPQLKEVLLHTHPPMIRDLEATLET